MRSSLILLLLALAAHVSSAASAAEPSAADLAAGKKLYVAKCARCHKFYDPSAYNDEKWGSWMAKMRVKARLNDEQFQKLSDYLNTVRHRSTEP